MAQLVLQGAYRYFQALHSEFCTWVANYLTLLASLMMLSVRLRAETSCRSLRYLAVLFRVLMHLQLLAEAGVAATTQPDAVLAGTWRWLISEILCASIVGALALCGMSSSCYLGIEVHGPQIPLPNMVSDEELQRQLSCCRVWLHAISELQTTFNNRISYSPWKCYLTVCSSIKRDYNC